MSQAQGTKYQVIPSKEHMDIIVKYFAEFSNESGRIHFTQKEMFDSQIVGGQLGSPSFMSGMLAYLINEGYIDKVSTGSRGIPSVWDVSLLLVSPDEIPTRESIGRTKPLKEEEDAHAYIDVAFEQEAIIAPKKNASSQEVVNNNNEVMALLNSTMQDMIGYLANMPIEMGGHLQEISSKLEASTDTQAVSRLQEIVVSLQEENRSLALEKSTFLSEMQSLKAELGEALSKPTYSTHSVYRQRNSIMDDVDRMITAPAWTIKQNGINIRNAIEKKLDGIMKEIGALIE